MVQQLRSCRTDPTSFPKRHISSASHIYFPGFLHTRAYTHARVLLCMRLAANTFAASCTVNGAHNQTLLRHSHSSSATIIASLIISLCLAAGVPLLHSSRSLLAPISAAHLLLQLLPRAHYTAGRAVAYSKHVCVCMCVCGCGSVPIQGQFTNWSPIHFRQFESSVCL